MRSLLFILLSTLCLFLTVVVALDHRQSVYDVAAATTPSKEEERQSRRTRTRRVLASSSTSSINHDEKEAVDPLNNYMVLAENEDALVRALGAQYGSIESPATYQPKPGKGVSHFGRS
jgi:uncharacterized protein YpmS